MITKAFRTMRRHVGCFGVPVVVSVAQAAGVSQVVFDRGGYLYHGRIKALADAARASGLEF